MDGFNAFGKPVSQLRRDAGYKLLQSFGLSSESAWSCTESASRHIEKDRPHEAVERLLLDVDLTGAYRLLAVLCTDPT